MCNTLGKQKKKHPVCWHCFLAPFVMTELRRHTPLKSCDATSSTCTPHHSGHTATRALVCARRIRVRDLLTHSAGFVTDDPWGDRQLDMDERAFSAYLAAGTRLRFARCFRREQSCRAPRPGVPAARSPGLNFEYSNLGYALLGRVAANVMRCSYEHYVEETLLRYHTQLFLCAL